MIFYLVYCRCVVVLEWFSESEQWGYGNYNIFYNSFNNEEQLYIVHVT